MDEGARELRERDESRDLAPPAVEGGRIDGRVTDFDGHPLVGVRVESVATGGGDLDLLPALTDGDGRFLLEGLAEGEYDLRFEIGRVRARTLGVPTGTTGLSVKLARPQGLLLVVRPAEGERPPDLLHVVLERETRSGLVREHVGRHLTSRMLLWSIRPGRYTVTVWGGPWLPAVAPGIDVREKEPAPEVQLLLSARGGAIRGSVLDATGESAANALVAWRPLDREGPWPLWERASTCDAAGRFLVQGLPSGRYRVSAGPAEGPFVECEVDVTEEATADVELRS